MVVVVKFGGTSLRDPARIRLAAGSVVREARRGRRVVVVVSAMGETTDELISLAREVTNGKITREELDEIVGMGEILSARILAAAIRSLGEKARAITPEMKEWPIMTDSTFGDARIRLEDTKKLVERFLVPMIKRGEIPVVCGFVGKEKGGRLTTLGRGGSDITAFVLSKCLKAEETIIVTDVDGILSADPRKVRSPKLIETITVEELKDLAMFGLKKMHPRALNYKDPQVRAKIVNFKWGDLSVKGTEIVGPKNAFERVRLCDRPLTMITVVGENMQTTPGILSKAVTPLSKSGINIYGVSIGPRSFSIYVEEKEEKRALELLHRVVRVSRHMKSVVSMGKLALIVCESEKFIDTPGMIAKLTQPLAKRGINIVEMMTSRASISFLLNWEDAKMGFEILKKTMEEIDEV